MMQNLIGKIPVNKQTKKLFHKKLRLNTEFRNAGKISSYYLPTVSTNKYKGNASENDFKCEDLTGIKIGRLQVVGLYKNQPRIRIGNKHKKTYYKWVVRCKCGRYEIRTHKTINKLLRNGYKHDTKRVACEECFWRNNPEKRA